MPHVTDLTEQISRLREKKTWNHSDNRPTPDSTPSRHKLRASLLSYFTYVLLAIAIASQVFLLVYLSLD